MDFSSITTLSALELYYHANRASLPDPIDDLLYDIIQGRDVKKVLQRSQSLGPAAAPPLTLALSFLPGLQRVEIPFAGVGDEGVREMGRALPGMKCLTSVGLAGNRVGPMGVYYLTSAISDLPGLIALDLSDNNIAEAGVGMLSHSLSPRVQRLGLRSIGVDVAASPSLLALFSTRPWLKSIDLQFNRCGEGFSPEELFGNNVALERLLLTGCNLRTRDLVRLFAVLPIFVYMQEVGAGFARHTPLTASCFSCVLPSMPCFSLMTVGDLSESELYTHPPSPLPVKCSTFYR